MAVALTTGRGNNTGTSSSGISTTNQTPTAGSLLIAMVLSRIASGAPAAPAVTAAFGLGAVWTKTYDLAYNGGGGANDTRITVWRCLVPAGSPAATAINADWSGVTQSLLKIKVDEYSGSSVTGTNAGDAFPQSQHTTVGTGTTDTVTLATLVNANSMAIGVVGHNDTNALTVGSGYTAIANLQTNAPTLSTEYKVNTTTVNGTWTSGLYGLLGFEVSAPSAPANTVAPVASGSTTIGSTVSTTNGTWTGDSTITYTYQWQRDVLANGVYSNISSATSSSYVLTSLDNATHVRCVVTGTNTQGNSSANSNAILDTSTGAGSQTFLFGFR